MKVINLFVLTCLFVSAAGAQIKNVNGVFVQEDFILPGQADHQYQKISSADIDTSRRFEIIKPEFMVNDLAGGGAKQTSPAAAFDGNGNYVIAWQDYRNGKCEIFAQFYDSLGKINGNIMVSKIPNEWNSEPYVAGSPKGGFVITWAQSSSEILAQRFTTNGQKIGEIIRVNNFYGNNTNNQSAAFNSEGKFIVCWSQQYSNTTKLYYKIYNSDGTNLTGDWELLDPKFQSISSIGRDNCAAADHKGNFVVVWSSYDDKISRIYLQQIGGDGAKNGSNQLVSDLTDNRNLYFPMISADKSGHFLISWQAQQSLTAKAGLMARVYNSNGMFTSKQLTITETSYYYSDLEGTASDGNGRFTIIYSNNYYFLKIIEKDGIISGEEERSFLVPDSGNAAFRSLIISGDERYCVLMNYGGYTDIYVQKLSSEYKPVMPAEKVNDDLYSSSQMSPDVHFNESGQSIVVWRDQRNGFDDLYAQVYNKHFSAAGKNIELTTNENVKKAVITSFPDGTFLIAYAVDQSSVYCVYLQKISSDGELIGSRIKIREISELQQLAVNTSDDRLLLSFYSGYPHYTLFFKEFRKDLYAVSYECSVPLKKGAIVPGLLSISVNKKFNILATWIDWNTNTFAYASTIKGILFNSVGNTLTDTLRIPLASADVGNNNFVCALDDENNCLILLTDYGQVSAKRFYGTNKLSVETNWPAYSFQYGSASIVFFKNKKSFIIWNYEHKIIGAFLDDISRKSNIFALQNYDPVRTDYYYLTSKKFNAAWYDSTLFVAYEANLSKGTGIDIMANIQKTERIDTKEEVFFPFSENDVLYNSFPNPFNISTKITYELLAYHKVKLAVYDILGREVKVLVNENQEKGLYQVELDGSDLSSGVYIIRLDAFDTSIKKIMLLK